MRESVLELDEKRRQRTESVEICPSIIITPSATEEEGKKQKE